MEKFYNVMTNCSTQLFGWPNLVYHRLTLLDVKSVEQESSTTLALYSSTLTTVNQELSSVEPLKGLEDDISTKE